MGLEEGMGIRSGRSRRSTRGEEWKLEPGLARSDRPDFPRGRGACFQHSHVPARVSGFLSGAYADHWAAKLSRALDGRELALPYG
jgi:hypothetical protein